MKRFLTLASGGLFAAGLAILPLGAFAQNGTDSKLDAKPVASTTKTSSADAKTVAPVGEPAATPAVKAEPGAKPAVAAKEMKTKHATPAAGTLITGSHPSTANAPAQPKTADGSKS